MLFVCRIVELGIEFFVRWGVKIVEEVLNLCRGVLGLVKWMPRASEKYVNDTPYLC